MSNRRRHPRYAVSGINGSLDGHPCELLRLSLGGLLATSRLEPPPERTIHLEFTLDGETFRSAGRVAFVGPDTHSPDRGWNRIGVEFMAVPTRSRRTLEKFLAGRPAAEAVPG
jgi:hypothetical protein